MLVQFSCLFPLVILILFTFNFYLNSINSAQLTQIVGFEIICGSVSDMRSGHEVRTVSLVISI